MLTSKEIKSANEFKVTHVRRGRDLFARLGGRMSDLSNQPSNLDETVPISMSKLDSLEMIQAYDKQMEIEHLKKMQEDYARELAEKEKENISLEA